MITKGQATLVGPAITNGGAPLGTAWLDQFMDECNKLGCQVDAISAHIYADPQNPQYYKDYISGLGKKYAPRKVLMTEIGTTAVTRRQGNTAEAVAQEVALMNELVPFLDGLDSVSHYAWFMVSPGLLVQDDGSLTTRGEAYLSA